MERGLCYCLRDRKDEFVKRIESEKFVYNSQTSKIRSEGVGLSLGVIRPFSRQTYLIISDCFGNESDLFKSERQRLMDLANKFN
jgi:hypothetical protein